MIKQVKDVVQLGPAGTHFSGQVIDSTLLIMAPRPQSHYSLDFQPRKMCRSKGILCLMVLRIMVNECNSLVQRKYVATLIQEEDAWPKLIYKTVDFNRKPFVR